MKFLIYSIIMIVSVVSLPITFAENTPDWVKNTAGWWANDAISETEFVNAIQFLVNEGIIQVSTSDTSEKSGKVPDWVKNTAGWWANDAISETEFVNAIQFLVNEGILKVENDCKFFDEGYEHLKKHEQEWLCEYPNFDFLDEWYNPIEITNSKINSLGLRNDEISIEKNLDTYRIFVVGGSTVFGDGVKIDETIPGNLKKEFLNDELNNIKNIEVINAGINGAWSKDEVKLIKNKIVKYDPDLIIVYDGWNDAKSGNYNQVREGEIHNEDSWKNRWSDICEKYNGEFEFIVILQPILNHNSKEILTNQEFTNLNTREAIIDESNNLDKYSNHIELLNEKCSGAYDFRNIVNDIDEGVYWDQGHMTPLGNKIIAKKIYELSIPIINKNFKLIESNDNTIYEKLINENKLNPKIDFRGKNIENGDFREQTISNIVAYISKFSNTDFSGSKISNMDSKFSLFNNVDFHDSKFENSHLTRTVFANSNFNNSDFSQTDFSTSKFHYSNLTNANFQNSNFRGIVMTDSILHNSNFENSDFSHSEILNVDFTSSSLKNSKFSGAIIGLCNLKGIDFSTIKISDSYKTSTTSFRNCNMQNSIFSQNDMLGVDFTSKYFTKSAGEYMYTLPGSDMRNASFIDVDLRKTFFSLFADGVELDFKTPEIRAEVRNSLAVKLDFTKFINADLRDNNMSYLNMRNAEITGSDLTNVSFKNSDLSFSVIKESNLTNVDLEGANLEGVIIKNTELEGANLKCINHKICE
jgi:uncharacterized protein YjbI with pentapeptide repeats/lysophospholipase L1-like esterase